MDKKTFSPDRLCAVKPFSAIHLCLAIILIFCSIEKSDCKEDDSKKPPVSPTQELLIGSWIRYNNRVHTLLIIRNNGNWSSDLRVEGATSKIIERKGESSGTWSLDGHSLTITVTASQMEEIWPTGTFVLEIVEIDKKTITLKYPNSRLITWKRARIDKDAKKDGDGAVTTINPVITMKPLIVNLNKISSNDKDRYLCLALDLNLEEMDATAPVPKLHPRAWDAAIIFLSSLLYNDVKTFDAMKVVTDKLTTILNPYFDGMLMEVASTHVMISSSMEKVDEFIIEHSPPPVLETTEGEKPAEEKGEEQQKSDKEQGEKGADKK